MISQEVDCVIRHRVLQWNDISNSIKDYLLQVLRSTESRTYLWVDLVLEHLKRENFKRTERGVDLAIEKLPKSVHEAYEKILSRSTQSFLVRRAWSIMLAASRPLTLTEMNIVINLEKEAKSFNDLDLEDDRDFQQRLRSLCGLFVSVHNHKVYFLIYIKRSENFCWPG